MTSLSRAAFTLALALASSACGGEEDTVVPFDVTLTPFSDCEQVGQGGVNCATEDELRSVTVKGRWIVDYRGADTFVLLTEDGRTVPGVYFPDTGQVETRACTGAGGTCHFARVRSASTDPQSGCPRNEERVVDLTVNDGQLTGEMSDIAFTEEGCGTSIIRELLIEVTGTEADEIVPARAEFTP